MQEIRKGFEIIVNGWSTNKKESKEIPLRLKADEDEVTTVYLNNEEIFTVDTENLIGLFMEFLKAEAIKLLETKKELQ